MTPDPAPPTGVGKNAQRLDLTGRSLAVRQAAQRAAATTSATPNPYISRMVDGAGEVPRSWPGLGAAALPDARHMAAARSWWQVGGRASWPLVIIAYGFFGLGIGINVWNAWTGGAIADVALPATMGVLAESVMFYLPSRMMALSPIRQVLALVLLLFVSAFALTNSLRMASIIATDQATARADRQTEGIQTADRALEAVRTRRDEACGRGLGKTVACQARQAEVTSWKPNRFRPRPRLPLKPDLKPATSRSSWHGRATASSSRGPMTLRCCGCCSVRSCRKWVGLC
jgi:hypothetical protein